MNQFQVSAPCPSSSEARTAGRHIIPVPSRCLPATPFNHREHMSPGTERGARSFGVCRATPVHETFVRGRGLLRTCRGHNRLRPFLASNFQIDQRSFQAFTDRSPSHFQLSSPSSFNASRISQKRRQGLGEVIRELGRFVQGSADE